MHKPPKILSVKTVAKSRLFHVQRMALEFSNGEYREYERLKSGSGGAVMILPILDGDTLLLIREYAAGVESYQLGFPKGLIDPGEAAHEAADRELKEEVGYGSNRLTQLKSISLAPGYFTHQMHIILAEELYPERLEGDEPEPVEVIKWPLADRHALLEREDFTESRSIAALALIDQYFAAQK